MKFLKKFGAYTQNNPEKMFVSLFFALLFLGLFLGDGKQAAIDVYIAGVTLCLYGLMKSLGLSLKPLPGPLYIVWKAVLVFYVLSFVFSISMALSFYSVIRVAVVFLLFQMFYSLVSPGIIRFFEKCVLWLVVGATLLGGYFFFFPPRSGDMVLMSLVYPNYGHNQLAVFYVFALPLLLDHARYWSRRMKWVLYTLFGVILFATLGRGAWIMACGYLLYAYFRDKVSHGYRRSVLLVGVIIFALFLLGSSLLSLFPQKTIGRIVPASFLRIVYKPPLFEDGRVDYWRQAIVSFAEKPMLGSGPGTFVLASKRLADNQGTIAWFPHSFPLELLSESGIAGFVLFVVLIIVVARYIKSRKRSPLRDSLCLLLLYSVFEYHLSFYVIFVLVIVSAAILVERPSRLQKNFNSNTSIIPLTLVGLFYALALVGTMMSVFPGNNLLSAFLNKQSALNVIATRGAVTPKEERDTLALWYGKHPEVLYALAEHSDDKNSKAIASWYTIAAVNDDSYVGSAIDYAISNRLPKEVGILLPLYLKKLLPQEDHDLIGAADFTSPIYISIYKPEDLSILRANPDRTLGLSKLFYNWGLRLIDIKVEKTQALWAIAMELSPNWSLFSIEAAALYHSLGKDDMAKSALEACEKNLYARGHCLQSTIDTLPNPGSQQEYIDAATNPNF